MGQGVLILRSYQILTNTMRYNQYDTFKRHKYIYILFLLPLGLVKIKGFELSAF